MKVIKILNNEILSLLEAEVLSFPKYATQILNLANQNAQGTRPAVVGQMSDLIQEFKGDKIKDWEEWYLNKHPEAISLAATKIFDMVNHFKEVMTQIDKEMIEKWVKDLVIIKTFVGLKFQEAILKYVAKQFSFSYRLAEPQEESQGIDGFINVIPVSIKPISYEIKKSLSEKILVSIIFYKKLKDGIKISYNENVFL
ncbi:MAG: restriction endonuclease [Spirochaetes bacterium GWF1_31_7]|nr:MAG: restriction endonuclease [Spirochaetes bacterium GWE1_32_154]OHD47144.1 MAG: restriction endonuclease [Spirochaetes bacterium GWF1_31_7]HBD94938.1 restriction endonuclease [Spirochaetia bacterium]HBI36076.1 restriction endonuclease [Spirochaetia bacterium]